MNKHYVIFLFSIIIAIIFTSCKKNENPVSSNNNPNIRYWKHFKRTGLNKTIAPNTFTHDTINVNVSTDNILSNYNSNINLVLDTIECTDVRDLKFVLIHQGAWVVVIDSLRKQGANFVGTIISDSATIPVDSSIAPYTGLFKPKRTFSFLKNLPTGGDYILRIINKGNLRGGVIKSWSVSVTYSALATNNCLEFNGQNNYAAIQDSPSLNSILSNNTFTFEGWYKILGYPYDYFSFLDKQDSWYFEYCKLDTSWNLIAPGVGTVKKHFPVALNMWYHIAISYDGSTNTAKFYSNGNYLGQVIYPLSFTANSNPLYIANGISGAQEYGNGRIDEVRIWNIVRTDAEILNSYNTSLTGTENGLVAYYQFNEGANNQIFDATVNNNDGILMNNPIWSEDGPAIYP